MRSAINARDAALVQLDRAHLPGWRSGRVRLRDDQPLDPRDRALAEQIRIGVVKNLLLLRCLIAHHSGRKLNAIDDIVQIILAIALYQLRFLERIPPSAAVDEAVEQTRRFRQSQASGFVNAVLRNALRNPDPPMSDEVRLSHPPELMQRLRMLLGDEKAIAFAEHDNTEPPTIVRLYAGADADRLRASVDESVQIAPHELHGMFVVTGAKQALFAELARSGVAQVQDPTAAAAADALGAELGEKLLDRCAGLGTKTLQLRDRIGPAGLIVAIDPDSRRCEKLIELARLREVDSNLHVFVKSRMREIDPAMLQEPFDGILIDAPCSNSGVLARRPEARYKQDDRSLGSLTSLQLQILLDTAPFVRVGGRIVYSTCSVWPEENESIVRPFLAANPQFLLEDSLATMPSTSAGAAQYHDGGYSARLRRAQSR